MDSDKIKIAQETGIPLSQVETVSSFYREESKKDVVCTGLPCYLKRNAKTISNDTETVSCLGYCDHAPVVRKNGTYFQEDASSLNEITESTNDYVRGNRQGIDSYIMEEGYSALEELIGSDDDSYVMRMLERSDLRGKGGAGFPAHLKWKSFRQNRNGTTYILVNAHEGEPGTFKDRAIMELFPHSVLEGAMISAFYNGAEKIYIGIKREYTNAYESLKTALEEMRVKFGEGAVSQMMPQIEIIRAGGSYVTGEETALMEALEDRRSEPRLRPPFPTEKGLYGRPTIVHNVETLSMIPRLLLKNKSTRVKRYCLTGDVKNPGLIDADEGISASHLLMEYGGSEPDSLKAFLPGGLSGGFLPSTSIDVKLDPESVKKTGASMGTGAFIALSNDRCMVDVTASVSSFFERESCGKCAPCRLGTSELTGLLKRLSAGTATDEDLNSGKQTAQVMIDGSICALGSAAGKMFLDSVRYFEDEYREHISGNCPAGTCSMDGGKQ